MRMASPLLSLRFLRGHTTRLALTVIALACGVGQIAADDMVGREALRNFIEVVDNMAGRAALQIHAGKSLSFPSQLAEVVARVDGVERSVPVISQTAFATDGSGEQILVHAMDLGDGELRSIYELHSSEGEGLDDPRVFLPDALVVSRPFAEKRGLALGSSIELETRNGRQRFTIRGLIEFQGIARVYGGNVALMDLANAQELIGEPGTINRIDVVVERDRRIEDVTAAIEASLPVKLQVEPAAQRRADLHRVMMAFRFLLWGLGIAGMLGAFLICYNSLSTMFERRSWQLGVLRAVGVRQSAVWVELTTEALFIGLAGSLLGIPIALIVAHVLLPEIATAVAMQAKLVTSAPQLIYRPSSLVLGVGVGISAALVAGAATAWRVGRTTPAITMRSRGIEIPQESPRLGRMARLAAFVFVFGATLVHWLSESPGWGLAATGGIILATGLASAPLIQFVAWANQQWGSALDPISRIAVKNLGENARRSALTVAMLAVGASSVLWLWTVADSFQTSVIHAVSSAMRADLVVSSSHNESGFLEAPVSHALLDEMQRLPSVRVAVANRIVDWQFAGSTVAVSAYDAEYFTSPDFGSWPLRASGRDDLWEAVARSEAAVVSTNFVKHFGLGLNDTLRLEGPKGGVDLPIAGIITQFGSPQGTIQISRELYRRITGDTQVTRVYVRGTQGLDVEALRSLIAERLGRKYSLRILSTEEVAEYFAGQVGKAFAGVYSLAAITLVLVLTGLGDTLAASVVERTREIGAIRVVGIRRSQVAAVIVREGLLIGILGLLLAIACGNLLGRLWVDLTFPALLGWSLEPSSPLGTGMLITLTTLVVCYLAASLPARQASRLDPAEAVRNE